MEAKVGIPVNGDVCPRKQRRKKQKMLVTELLLDYAKNSTLHGLRYITEPGVSVIEKTFWGLIFTISIALCFMFILKIYSKWVETPVIVSLNEHIVPVGMFPFPSVTICPQQKILWSRYEYLINIFIEILNGSNYEYGNEVLSTKVEDISLLCGFGRIERIAHSVERNVSDSSLINNILEVSPAVEDVFFLCIWRGDLISKCKDLFTKVLTQEGVCYNFNSLAANEIFKNNSTQHDYSYMDSSNESKNWNTLKNKYVNVDSDAYPRRGRANGAEPDLQVFLDGTRNNYDPLCNGVNKGYKIYLHHPTDYPQSSLYYYAALPKQVSSLALKFNMMTTSHSLKSYSSEIRKCYFPEDRPLRYFQIYTLSNCQLECQSNYTFKQCGCYWFHMPHDNSQSICTIKRLECVTKALDDLAELELKAEIDSNVPTACRCFPACDSIYYDAEILKTDYDASALLTYKFENLSNDTRKEYSKIEMYFKEPRFVSMRRSELYGRNEFLANCGGLLGLFLGFSFLSLVEIIYFTTLRLCCHFKRDLKAEKKNSDKRND